MGLENRDYIRESSPRSGFGYRPTGDLWAVKYLIIANIAVFVLQMATATRNPGFPGLHGGVSDWLSLNLTNIVNPNPTQGFQIWRLLTYGFCHGGLMHLAFNMYALWLFGRLVEPIYGSREFLYFFLVGVLISGLCHIGVQAIDWSPAGVIGASGGVMAVVLLAAMTFPHQRILLMFVIPVEFRVLAIIVVGMDLFGVLNPQGDSVAHWAHLGGAAFGMAYKHFNWRISGGWNDLMSRWRLWRIRRRSKARLYQPDEKPKPQKPTDDIGQKVDELLDKISKHGESSLTDSEREFLAEASRRYRDR